MEKRVLECHCGHDAIEYYNRSYTNQLNQKVLRTFYRCTNCWSRIDVDEIPEMDNKQVLNMFDVMSDFEKYKHKFKIIE